MKHDYEKIAKEIVDEHTIFANGARSYKPIYWDQGGSEMDDDAMSAFLAGDDEEWMQLADDVLDEWVSESIWVDATTMRDEYTKGRDLPDDFDEDELRDEIKYGLDEACTQDYTAEWIKDMGNPIVRVPLGDGLDPAFTGSDDEVTPEILLDGAGIEATQDNLKAAQVIINEAYYPGCWRSLFLVFRLDLSQVASGDTVNIKGDVELWACNPFAGDGMADTVTVDITVPRSSLATDKGAAGYSYDAVFGPTYSNFDAPTLTFTMAETPAAN